ncbi:DsbC family protein [Acinetobacter rudis]|uniref:DsbC family protein n=1 Tax=Acinetobacter rudis TaxID=632955 RepID=UPI00280D3679|nr:DsbC family protein [Acinetobacter rudis]MDQ8953555.1 DsbC family protein [Acinetobacter rudis]
MKSWLSVLLLSIATLGTAHADIATVQKNLKTNFPDIPVNSVNTTQFKDIYEVYMGGRIVYTNDDAKYFLVGNLIDLPNQVNITEQRQQVLSSIDVSKLPLNQAIKKVKGKGQRVIYLFSDPDCPYCKKLEAELDKVDNLTIYLFINPITSLHPTADKTSKQIWCSSQPYQAWTDYTLKGIAPTAKDSCKNPIDKNLELAKKLEVTGTPTFFLKDGRRISGALPATELEMMLNEIK